MILILKERMNIKGVDNMLSKPLLQILKHIGNKRCKSKFWKPCKGCGALAEWVCQVMQCSLKKGNKNVNTGQ